jgi:hypothetical protein
MKTFFDIAYSSGVFWRCVGDPTEAPGQSCAKIPSLDVAAAVGLVVCLALLTAILLRRRR